MPRKCTPVLHSFRILETVFSLWASAILLRTTLLRHPQGHGNRPSDKATNIPSLSKTSTDVDFPATRRISGKIDHRTITARTEHKITAHGGKLFEIQHHRPRIIVSNPRKKALQKRQNSKWPRTLIIKFIIIV